MFLNYSNEETPKVSQEWKNKDQDSRREVLEGFISVYEKFKLIEVLHCSDHGYIEVRLLENISVSERGLFLIDFEENIKFNIDQGLTVWCEPIGDKNSLRNLRGIQIK